MEDWRCPEGSAECLAQLAPIQEGPPESTVLLSVCKAGQWQLLCTESDQSDGSRPRLAGNLPLFSW